MQLTVMQIWSLELARCRFGKYLRVSASTGPHGLKLDMARLLRDFPAQKEASDQGELLRGLGVRLALQCVSETGAASAELQLGERAKFYPSDAALASWWAQAAPGKVEIIYE